MHEGPPPQRFIPFRRSDVVRMCADEQRLSPSATADFDDLCRILEAVLHFEYHDRLEALKASYAPFDPDADTRALAPVDSATREAAQQRFLGELEALLDAANFERVTDADLGKALHAESLLKVRLHVALDDFEDVAFYRRGASLRTVTVSRFLGLSKRTLEFQNYDRVVIYVRFRDTAHFEGRRHPPAFAPGSTVLKLFQNVPRPDLEMLFPNSEVRMRPIDKLTIGVPAVAGGIVIVATKLLASLGVVLVLLGFWLGLTRRHVHLDEAQLVALGAGIGSVGAYLFRQVSKYKSRKIAFMKTLAESLYFKNLDNDAGVFHNLLDAAEEEDHKEAVLAYWSLLTEGPASTRQLDAAVERWLAERWACSVDFEVADALAKLDRLGLAREEDGRWHATPPREAKAHLDRIWDGYFTWSNASSGAP